MDSALVDAKIAEAAQKRADGCSDKDAEYWRGISDGLTWLKTQEAAEQERKRDGHDQTDHQFMIERARDEYQREGNRN